MAEKKHIHAAVDRLLLEQNHYCPLELLLETGRLPYTGYEAWRYGRIKLLDEVIAGNREQTMALLETGAAWARQLLLEAETVSYEGWGRVAGQGLIGSDQPQLERLLCTRYRQPAHASPQLDIFMNSNGTAVLNRLRDALVCRDPGMVEKQLHRLIDQFPDHALRASCVRMHDSLHYLERGIPPGQTLQWLDKLTEHLLPAAQAVLGGRARDFMAPFWRQCATALADTPFDSARPRAHASWVYAQCLDWQGVRASIRATAGFPREPVLVARMAEAEYRLHGRAAALQHWCNLCWRFPQAAEVVFDHRQFPDISVKRMWESFQDLEPALEIEWLPAWFLLNEAACARTIPMHDTGATAPPIKGFGILQALLRRDKTPSDAQELELRKTLQAAHPGVLRLYLERK